MKINDFKSNNMIWGWKERFSQAKTYFYNEFGVKKEFLKNLKLKKRGKVTKTFGSKRSKRWIELAMHWTVDIDFEGAHLILKVEVCKSSHKMIMAAHSFPPVHQPTVPSPLKVIYLTLKGDRPWLHKLSKIRACLGVGQTCTELVKGFHAFDIV